MERATRPFVLKRTFIFLLCIIIILPAVLLVFLFDYNYLWVILTGLLTALLISYNHMMKFDFKRDKNNLELRSQELLELARRHSRFRLSEEGGRYYSRAVESLFKRGEIDKCLDVFSEYFDLYERVFEPRFQLKLCQELFRRGHYELSARALEILIENWDVVAGGLELLWKEKAYLRLGRILAEKLECLDYARHLFCQFLRQFPNSRFREQVEYQLMAIEARRAQRRFKEAS